MMTPRCIRYSHRISRRAGAIAFAASLLLFGCRDGASAGDETGAAASSKGAAGQPADFRMKTLDGRPLGPKDFPGKVVVIDFWATWCGPCHIQARILESVAKDLKGKRVQFLAANVGEGEETVRDFLKGKPVPYPVLVDPDDVAGELGVFALPTVMVIDTKGRISYSEPGISDGPTIRKAIAAAGA